mmetsp:Transcript_12111/g.18037  ORF Transcript_12111/g.18037 Transcript_12111/m.18037 type:complete len:156 (-) Transcript_12111:158-625(-)
MSNKGDDEEITKNEIDEGEKITLHFADSKVNLIPRTPEMTKKIKKEEKYLRALMVEYEFCKNDRKNHLGLLFGCALNGIIYYFTTFKKKRHKAFLFLPFPLFGLYFDNIHSENSCKLLKAKLDLKKIQFYGTYGTSMRTLKKDGKTTTIIINEQL